MSIFPILYHNYKYSEHLGLQITNEHGDEFPVFQWNPMFLRCAKNSNYSKFTGKAMRVAYMIIHGIDLPRMPKEGRELVHSVQILEYAIGFSSKIKQ